MVVEIAVGTAVSWLWGKLADAAEAKDQERAIKKALQESINESFRQFQTKYSDLSESFFNQDFLEAHVCPEVLKYLTRDQQPDLVVVSDALPVNALFVSESGFRDEIKEFFDMIFDCMKSHVILQEIINYRQIEETNQIVKVINEDQKSTNKLLEQGFNDISFEQKETLEKSEKSLQTYQIFETRSSTGCSRRVRGLTTVRPLTYCGMRLGWQ